MLWYPNGLHLSSLPGGPRLHRDALRSRLRPMRLTPVLLAALAVAPVARAQRWTRVAPGLALHRDATPHATLPRVVHALRVDLCNPAVTLRVTAPRERLRTVADWARRVGAFAAINGDYFDPATGQPLGPTRGHGTDWPAAVWTTHEALLLAAPDGRVALRPVDLRDGDRSAPAALAPPEWTELLAARERVLVEGVARDNPALGPHRDRHPRTGLGLSRDGHTLFLVVIEGRVPGSVGATARELGDALRALGAWEGVKLDGGGSSALFVRGRGQVSRPSDGTPRPVATHLGVRVRRVPAGTPARCTAIRAPTRY